MKKYLLLALLLSSCGAMFRMQPMSQPAISGDRNIHEDTVWYVVDTGPSRIDYKAQGWVVKYNNDTLPANLLVSILEKPLAVEDRELGDLYTVFTMQGYVVGNKVFLPELIYLDGSKKPLPKSIIVWNYKLINYK